MSTQPSIFVEQAEILEHKAFEGDQWIMRVQAPKCAAATLPGQFAHITCHPLRLMRRPISIMRTSPKQGWVDFLYKVVGEGTELLSAQVVGESVSLIAPIGKPFTLSENTKHHLLIVGGVGMPPMVAIADALQQQGRAKQTFALLGSEVPFPFNPQPSTFMINGIPDGVIATMPLMEDWRIACRLASLQAFAGCFQGYITELASLWLEQLSDEDRKQTMIYSCGPTPMLEAVAKVSAQYHVAAQLSLEEHMACAVGGCAGCTQPITEEGVTAMKRVCVDGPVFSAQAVYPELFTA